MSNDYLHRFAGANWLPAPDGPIYAILRIYMPAPEVVRGAWKKPRLQPESH